MTTPKPLRVLSLFDGISCLRVALGDRPISYYGASEIDDNAIAVSLINWDDITHLGDVCKIKDVKDIDLLCGGSPCTDLSRANSTGKGLKGERSKLFYEYLRILKETKPRYFILENVASMKWADRGEITKELGVQPIMIDAGLVSAQSRKRLFWTNIPVKGLPVDRMIKLSSILQNNDSVDDNYFRRTPTGMTSIKKQNDDFDQLGYFGVKNACGVGGQALRVYDVNKKSTTSGVGLYKMGDRIRRLTPLECERLQSLPDYYTDFLESDALRYKCLGNGFNVEVIKFILSFMP